MILEHLNRLFGFLFILIGVMGIVLLSSKKNFQNKIILFISAILPIIGFSLITI